MNETGGRREAMEAARATLARLARSTARPHHRCGTARIPPSPQLTLHLAAALPRALLLRRAMASYAEQQYNSRALAGLQGAGGGSGGCGSGGGGGRGRGRGQGQGQGGGCDMGEYYRRVLRVDPGNPLLLRNYGKYLHEVEGDLAGADGCYARALLADPGDADLLSLYGLVIWEAHQEKDRAADYFERAVQAAPDDCYVLGSYARFLWDTEHDDDEEEAGTPVTVVASCDSAALSKC